MGASIAQVLASHAETDGLLGELEGAATLSSFGSEFIDSVSAVLLGDTIESHLASLSARDHLVGSDFPVVAAVTLGFAHGSALAGVLDGLLGGLGRLSRLDDDFVATSVSTSLSTDFTTAVCASSVVASARVVVLSFGMESLHSELSASDDSESFGLLSGGLLTRKFGSQGFSSLHFSGLCLGDSGSLGLSLGDSGSLSSLSFGDSGSLLSGGFLSGSFIGGSLFGKLNSEGFGCGNLSLGISQLLKVSHSSSSFSNSSPVLQAVTAVPDVHVSSVVISRDGAMVMTVPAGSSVNLFFAVVVPVVEDGNPRVFSYTPSVVPFGLVGASLA